MHHTQCDSKIKVIYTKTIIEIEICYNFKKCTEKSKINNYIRVENNLRNGI